MLLSIDPSQYSDYAILVWFGEIYNQNIDYGMLRSAQSSQFSTYPIQNIDIPSLAVLHCD